MRIAPGADQVRDLVRQTFEDYEADPQDLFDLCENILIDDGRYVARSYEAGGLMAMWLIPVGIVQFYDAEGNLLRTINLFEQLEPARLAA